MGHRRMKTRHCTEKSCSRQKHTPCSSAPVQKFLATPLTLYPLKLSNNNYKSMHRVCLCVHVCVCVCMCVCVCVRRVELNSHQSSLFLVKM